MNAWYAGRSQYNGLPATLPSWPGWAIVIAAIACALLNDMGEFMGLMGKRMVLVSLLLLLPVAASGASEAAQSWPVYRGDAIGYLQAGLPDPMVLYAFASNGELIGVVDNDGRSDAQTMQQVAAAIEQARFAPPVNRRLDETAKALTAYLQDQGYALSDIVSRHSKYTLLLLTHQRLDAECPFFAQETARFKHIIGDAARKAGGASVYTLAVLDTDAPIMKVRCPKS